MPDFEWVKARAECSVGIVFQKLKDHVKADVEERQTLAQGQHIHFEFGDNSASSFSVFREGGNTPVVFVKFLLKDGQIVVMDDDEQTLVTASVTLDNEGKCKLKVNSVNLEEWQFRKMALEELFFSETKARVDPFAKFGGKKLG